MKEKHTGTILVFVVVLVILFFVYRNQNFLYASLIFGGIGLFFPWLSQKIHWVWMKFAELLGSVMNKVLLSVVFFVFLVPIAAISRMFRKGPFSSKSQVASYYTDRNYTFDAKNLEESW